MMSKKVAIVWLLIALPSLAQAQLQEPVCAPLKRIRLEMAVAASNIANVNTTRTPDGGSYRTQELICRGDICEMRTRLNVKNIYDPEHPDSDGNGYVAYPNIDIHEQEAKMNELIQDYEIAVRACSHNL